MKAQRVKIELPEVELLVNGVRVAHLESGAIDVVGIRDLRKAISKMISEFGPSVLTDAVSAALTDNPSAMTLEDGKEIPFVLECTSESSWRWQANVADDAIHTMTGGTVAVGYGSYLHKTLFQIATKPNYTPTSKARDSLEAMFLIDSNGDVTTKGQEILDELLQEDISIQTKRRLQFSGALLAEEEDHTPAFQFALQNDYIREVAEDEQPREFWYVDDLKENDWEKGDRIYPTLKGKDWLVTYAEYIRGHPECSDKKKKQLIPFLPPKYLPEILAGDDQFLKKVAAQMIQMTKEGVTSSV